MFRGTLPVAQDWRQQTLLTLEMRQRVERRQAWGLCRFLFDVFVGVVEIEHTIVVLKLWAEPGTIAFESMSKFYVHEIIRWCGLQ